MRKAQDYLTSSPFARSLIIINSSSISRSLRTLQNVQPHLRSLNTVGQGFVENNAIHEFNQSPTMLQEFLQAYEIII